MAAGAQTADRALGLLLLAVESEQPLSLAELGEESGLNKAGTYRLVQTLVERSLLEKEPGGRRYVAGTGLIALAGTVMRKLSIRQAAHPMLRRIAEHTPETVSLDVRHRRYHVCVDVIESVRPIRRVVTVGEMVALYEGTASKAILPWLAVPEYEDVLAWAKAEGHDVKRLEVHVKQARRDGFFAAVGDRIPGAGALSVPFFDLLGVKGSLTVSGPGDRLSLAVMKDLAPLVVAECAELSRALGYGGEFPDEDEEPAPTPTPRARRGASAGAAKTVKRGARAAKPAAAIAKAPRPKAAAVAAEPRAKAAARRPRAAVKT